MIGKMNGLPDAELSIMLVLWKSGKAITSNEILENLLQKHWHIATVNKLLSRLLEKGFVDIADDGRPKKYMACIRELEYKAFESKSFLSRLHRNSMSSLIAALYADDGLTCDDLKEIEDLIERKRGTH